MKILVVAPAWVGDTVMAQPMFRLLHERHANLALDVLAPLLVYTALASRDFDLDGQVPLLVEIGRAHV